MGLRICRLVAAVALLAAATGAVAQERHEFQLAQKVSFKGAHHVLPVDIAIAQTHPPAVTPAAVAWTMIGLVQLLHTQSWIVMLL